ncbi:MAG: hypothetical protein K9H62_18045 [Bacteroidales bacterium]|nr:hypothetical protein [Bacteroidales bacterium]
MIDLLYYNDLDFKKVSKQFDKVAGQLAQLDFNSAEVKKITESGLYRAKLDYENRLLFKFATYNEKTYILLLEVIYNHDYDKSRFLRGTKIDESKFVVVPSAKAIDENEADQLMYVNPALNKFHLLDKVISFDAYQEEVFRVKPPVIIIGSAGSGKTALTLEKLKTLKGRVLYVTLSPFLVENSSNLYYSHFYENEKQEIDFLSFADYCSTIRILKGHEMDQRAFGQWMQTRAHVYGIRDVHKLFEEFRGVLTGMEVDKPYLSRKDYLDLGVRRSIFLGPERDKVYDVFEKYLEFIGENGMYDLNMVSYEYLEYCKPAYDFVVVDEMQDFTNIQLFLILKSLNTKGSFILCGDSNQIVHPNFFSWTNVKSMFYKQDMVDRDIKVLRTNYRNSTEITVIANRLLKIKHARFGSIDKESTYLIEAVGNVAGEVTLLKDSDKVRQDLNKKTSRSTRFAVLVMRQEDKTKARKIFKTPLLFSIHESKGLEYENVIILNFVSDYAREFNEIIQPVNEQDIDNDELVYGRQRDKTDKSLDAYKFYINSLYVAITRGIQNIYVVEANHKHKTLQVLNLVETGSEVRIKENVSSAEDWKKEAERLEKQGKKEHADEIRKVFFAQEQPDWVPLTSETVAALKKEAFDPDNFNKKAKDKLFAYALLYEELEIIDRLANLKYRRAEKYEEERGSVYRKYYPEYKNNDLKQIARLIGKYGINYRDQFNLTPLLAAIQAGSIKAIPFLLERGADITMMDGIGRNPFRTAIVQNFNKQMNQQVADLVFGAFVSDTVRLKIDDKLVIIPSRKFEFLLLNFLLSVQKQLVSIEDRPYFQRGIRAQTIAEALEDYPEQLVPGFRKKKNYVSAMLSKNEIEGNSPYNHKIMLRVQHGEYLLNRDMEMMVNDEWKNVYDLMNMDKPVYLSEEQKAARVQEEIEYYRRKEEEARDRLRQKALDDHREYLLQKGIFKKKNKEQMKKQKWMEELIKENSFNFNPKPTKKTIPEIKKEALEDPNQLKLPWDE